MEMVKYDANGKEIKPGKKVASKAKPEAKPTATKAKPEAKPTATKATPKAKPKAEPKPKKETCTSFMTAAIIEGKLTDAEIFKAAQEKFGLSDDKKTYVNWYRCQLRRKGVAVPPKVVAAKA